MGHGNISNRIKAFFRLTILFFAFSLLLGWNYKVVPSRAADVPARTLSPSTETVIRSVRNYMLSKDKDPDYASIWNAIGMARSPQGIPDNYKKEFYDNIVNYMIDNNWDLDTNRSSDYSKLILAMTVIGKDARSIYGHNLFDYLDDFKYLQKQGFNGPVWALIALHSHPDYYFTGVTGAANPTTEEKIIEYILAREVNSKVAHGGWTLYGDTPDVDITAMTIQALAPYYGMEGRDKVTAAIDRALTWLSIKQYASGGFGTLNGTGELETSESCSQAIIALAALGIDPAKDTRFIKNGAWPMSRLFEYYLREGGFMHVSGSVNNGGGAGGTLDGMATEQGMCAVVAYVRMLNGDISIYDMSDISLSAGGKPDTPSKKETDSKVPVTKLTLDKTKLTLKKGKSQTLKVTVTPKNASNKNVTWSSSNKKVATVTQKGVVKAVKAGTAKITVTAKDGSKKKATCTVTVKNTTSGASTGKKQSGSNKSQSGSTIKVSSVGINYKQISLAAGSSRSLSVTVLPSNASNRKVKWSSSNSSVASVDSSGKVTGRSSGTATITARAADGSGRSSTCTVIVYGGTNRNQSTSQQRLPQGSNTNQNAARQTVNSQNNSANQGGQSGQNTDNKKDDKAEESTEAEAWSFDGEDYIPEFGEETGDSLFEDYDPDQEEATTEAGLNIESVDNMKKSGVPIWTVPLAAGLGGGACAAFFLLPAKLGRKEEKTKKKKKRK